MHFDDHRCFVRLLIALPMAACCCIRRWRCPPCIGSKRSMRAILRHPRGEGVSCFRGCSELLSRWEGKLPRDQTWRENYNTYLSRSSVAGTANSVDHSLFLGGHTKYASIVENSFRMFALILVIFIHAGKQRFKGRQFEIEEDLC